MPVHDWTRVDAGVFHDFHTVWIALLRIALNSGILPKGFYAMSEQHGGKYIADILTLHRPVPTSSPEPSTSETAGGIAVAESPPRLRHHMSLEPAARTHRKTLTIRHVGNDRIVAMLEIVSAANKDRKKSVAEFLNKLEHALYHGIHVVLVDLFPPGRHDPLGMHGALWQRLGGAAEGPPHEEPLTIASYVADAPLDSYWEYLSLGSPLPDAPLFLDPETYIKLPLEATYMTAWQSTPEPYRMVLEPPNGKARRKRRR
jgi:hypothetical protein